MDFKDSNEAIQYINDAFKRAFDGHISESITARDAFKIRIGFQGLVLNDQDFILNAITKEKIASLKKVEWSTDRQELEAIIVPIQTLDFITVDINLQS